MVSKRLMIVLLVLAFISFSPHLAEGQRYEVIKFHTGKQYCFGTRASGMGGAYSSIADDAAGIFYNPAGIAGNREMQAYVEAGTKRHRGYVIEGLEDGLGGKNTFPHYVGISLPVKGVSVGIAHYVPYRFRLWKRRGTGYDPILDEYISTEEKLINESTLEATSVVLAAGLGNKWLIGTRFDYCHLKEKDRLLDGSLEADGLAAALGLLYNHNFVSSSNLMVTVSSSKVMVESVQVVRFTVQGSRLVALCS